jgi:hypothetical protein
MPVDTDKDLQTVAVVVLVPLDKMPTSAVVILVVTAVTA